MWAWLNTWAIITKSDLEEAVSSLHKGNSSQKLKIKNLFQQIVALDLCETSELRKIFLMKRTLIFQKFIWNFGIWHDISATTLDHLIKIINITFKFFIIFYNQRLFIIDDE